MKWSGLENYDPLCDEWDKAIRRSERKKELERNALLWFACAILFSMACALLYVHDPSWFKLINPLAFVIIIGFATYAGVKYLGKARRIRRW